LKRPNFPIDPGLRHPASGCEDCENDRKPVCVAIVDDDAAIRDMITGYLSEHGITPIATSGWPEMSGCMATGEIDLVILDLRLGREDGFDVLREIRSHSDIPVIITSGHRRDEIDRVIGLELGADDYLTKPFGLRELLARIRAVLRRKESEPEEPDVRKTSTESNRYSFGGWQLDRRALRLTNPEGTAVPLTKSEYALLIAFLEAPQRPLTREYLLQATRVHEDIFDRSIDVQVLRLRRKLESDPASPRFIQTERGVGYVFALPVQKGPTATP
jgi:DNA-binding response OmpR family regulator